MEEETSPYTKEQLEDGTLEYGEIAWRIEGYNSTYLNLRSQLYSQTTSQSAGTALAAEASALMEDAMDLKSDDMDAETRELFEGYKAAARELRKQGAKLTNKELSGTYARTLRQTKNKLVKAVQNLLIQYEELLPQVETAKKNVEMCQVNARPCFRAGGPDGAEGAAAGQFQRPAGREWGTAAQAEYFDAAWI